MISKTGVALIGGVIALAVMIGLAVAWVEASKRAAVIEERRARTADAIDLIRTTDKKLGVLRKASDADLCRAMGGQPGECS